MPVIKALFYELFVRAYRLAFLRIILRLFFKKRAPKGYIFLVGSYNAGTTIVKNAVSAHPDVSQAPVEGDVLTSGLINFEQGGWPRGLLGNAPTIARYRNSDELNAESIESDWRPWIKENKFFFEKSISHSVRIEQLRKAFPGSRFICVVRQPEDVVKGIIKRSKPASMAANILGSNTYPKKFLMLQWAYIYRLILLDSQPQDTCFYYYEEFIDSPVETVLSLFKFLGLSDTKVDFNNNKLTVDAESFNIRPLEKLFSPELSAQTYAEETSSQLLNQLLRADT